MPPSSPSTSSLLSLGSSLPTSLCSKMREEVSERYLCVCVEMREGYEMYLDELSILYINLSKTGVPIGAYQIKFLPQFQMG